ncbi:MAG: hypothetical protein ACXAEU_21565 [Candidatus Hodarchaeales archaeon]|jgi:hypothetical protein
MEKLNTTVKNSEESNDPIEVEDKATAIINLARYIFFLMTSPRPVSYKSDEENIDLSNVYHGMLASEIEQLCAENAIHSDEALAYLNYMCEITGLELVNLDLDLILPKTLPSDDFFKKGIYMIRTPNAIEDSMDNIEYAVTGLCIYLFQKQGPFPEKDFKLLVNTLRPYSRKSNGNNGKKREYYPSSQIHRTFKNLVSTGYLWKIKKSNRITYSLSPKVICMFPRDKREALHHQIDRLLLRDMLEEKE